MDSLWWLSLIVLPLAALAGILVFAAWFARRVTDRFVGRTHRWIEEIMETGEAPAAWRSRQTRLPAIARQFLRRSEPEQAQASYLRRLDGLIAYTERSPLMGDAETKEVVLERLDEVYDDWAQRSPGQFGSNLSQFITQGEGLQ
ncbi:MAG: hypothetical protein FJ011_21770 [Chloroflexi bacterium]|nr:hypothetical protein [Chloroflexota bacterium]